MLYVDDVFCVFEHTETNSKSAVFIYLFLAINDQTWPVEQVWAF